MDYTNEILEKESGYKMSGTISCINKVSTSCKV